jgi:hypothetical protein
VRACACVRACVCLARHGYGLHAAAALTHAACVCARACRRLSSGGGDRSPREGRDSRRRFSTKRLKLPGEGRLELCGVCAGHRAGCLPRYERARVCQTN